MRNKKKNRIYLLILLLLGISIGFAALATTLKIDGNATIVKNNWDIYWDNIANQNGVTPSVSEIVDEDATHKKNIVNFTVTLDKPGDYYEFTVDAVNNGSLDAMITEIQYRLNGELISDNNKLPDYIKYTVTYANGRKIKLNQLLEKKQNDVAARLTYKVRVYYDENAVTNANINDMDDEGEDYNLSFYVKYGQADDNAIPATPEPDSFATDDWDTIAYAIKSGNISKYHACDKKSIDAGVFGTQTLMIYNMTTPSECDNSNFSQSGCGFVIGFENAIGMHSINSNGSWAGSWSASDMRSYLNTTVYNNLPSDLKEVIKETKVYTAIYGESTLLNESTDKLYLPSEKEAVGYGGYSNETSVTRQLECVHSVKSLGNDLIYWWTRTPNTGIRTYGDSHGGWSNAANEAGVVPLFRIG